MDERSQRFLTACVDMAGRMGASSFQIRYEDSDKPVIWMAYAEWNRGGPADGHADCAAALSPTEACYRLLEALMDGGTCQHCKRPTAVLEPGESPLPIALVCSYTYDAEAGAYVKGCK